MKHTLKYMLATGVALLMLSSCNDKIDPDWPGPNYQQNLKIKPLTANNNIVAHRGGSKEADLPDNSIASLEYAMELRCYASECDIYITSDNKVIVAHADGQGKVNGFYPYDATYNEIAGAGKLSNGEKIPLLEEYLAAAVKRGSCTRVWLDIKKIADPVFLPQPSISACTEACRIIEEMGVQEWVEFICTGEEQVMDACLPVCDAAGINIAWMAGGDPQKYINKGIKWANVSTGNIKDITSTAPYSAADYLDNGLVFSIYTIDKTDNLDIINKKYGTKVKAVCTNYPKQMLTHLEKI